MNIETISFDEVPKTSRLFKDYLYNFPAVASYYQSWDPASIRARVPSVLNQSYFRSEVADVLLDQNKRAGACAATLENLERFRQADSVVIITGQQAGLFSGPLYTIYKALSALRLAEELRAEGINAIPFFWVAAEDHDFAEVNNTFLVNREGQPARTTYTACSPSEGKPVGDVELCPEIDANIEEFLASLPESEFVSHLANDLKASYKAGKGFADAFSELVMKFLGKYGIVLINPLDARLKRISKGIFAEAMEKSGDYARALVAQSRDLEEAGYHAQVYTSEEAVPLFILDEGRRTAMLQKGGRYFLKGSDKSYAADEMLEMVRTEPEKFSPNVTLRPVIQDFLLPTLAYIGGPAEIAYFAQILAGYRTLGRLEPLVLPRASFTVIEGRHAKTLRKYGLAFKDLFAGFAETMTQVVEKSMDKDTASVFDETEAVFTAQLEKLKTSLEKVDPPLAAALKGGQGNILANIQRLRATFVKNLSQRDDAMKNQIEKAFNILYPDKGLQEREVNVAYFISRFGYEIIDRIYEAVDTRNSDHKLLYL